jgi:CMP-N-acetylneuraminic acid synthetase
MALYKLSKPKTFQLEYCGCTPATGLLSEQMIRNAIELMRQGKSKRDYVKTTVTITREGIKIIYNNEQKFTTNVPANMIAGSTMGKSSLQNTVGKCVVIRRRR